jgi:hypothetical protein
LGRAKVKVHGMVVRGVRPDNDGYYYSYYHRYYGNMENRKDKSVPKAAKPPEVSSAVAAVAAQVDLPPVPKS